MMIFKNLNFKNYELLIFRMKILIKKKNKIKLLLKMKRILIDKVIFSYK